MFDVAPGKEEEFRYLERALALSDWLDRLIEVTEPPGQSQPVPVLTAVARRAFVAERQREAGAILRAAKAAGRPRRLRAGFASRLAHVALALHRDAAAATMLQPEAEARR